MYIKKQETFIMSLEKNLDNYLPTRVLHMHTKILFYRMKAIIFVL